MQWPDIRCFRVPGACNVLVLVHGEPGAQATLAELINVELAAPVHVAGEGDRFDLLKPVPF